MFYDSRHTCDALNTGHEFLYAHKNNIHTHTQNTIYMRIYSLCPHIYYDLFEQKKKQNMEK